jgi:hypothetical protein
MFPYDFNPLPEKIISPDSAARIELPVVAGISIPS